MRYLLFLFCCIPTAALSNQGDNATFYNEQERGWFWYETKPISPVETEKKEKKSPSVSTEPVLSPREILRKQGEELEDTLAVAVMDPSDANVLAYLAKMAKLNKQSEHFANRFKQAIWINPEFDLTLKKPINAQAIVARNEVDNRQQKERLLAIGEEKGLLFYFRSDCPHCHRFAPILKQFSETYGITVIPVSLDGGALPEYLYPKKDHAMGQKLKVSIVPAVFLVSPRDNTVAAASYGFTDITALAQKVMVAAERMDKDTE